MERPPSRPPSHRGLGNGHGELGFSNGASSGPALLLPLGSGSHGQVLAHPPSWLPCLKEWHRRRCAGYLGDSLSLAQDLAAEAAAWKLGWYWAVSSVSAVGTEAWFDLGMGVESKAHSFVSCLRTCPLPPWPQPSPQIPLAAGFLAPDDFLAPDPTNKYVV